MAWEYLQNIKGPKGNNGENGATGPEGPQGPKGNDGTNGADGVGINEITVDESTVSGGSNMVSIHTTDGKQTDFIIKNGIDGATGPQGEQGANGQGVASGGTTGQILQKKSDTDYDTEWVYNKGGLPDTIGSGAGAILKLDKDLNPIWSPTSGFNPSVIGGKTLFIETQSTIFSGDTTTLQVEGDGYGLLEISMIGSDARNFKALYKYYTNNGAPLLFSISNNNGDFNNLLAVSIEDNTISVTFKNSSFYSGCNFTITYYTTNATDHDMITIEQKQVKKSEFDADNPYVIDLPYAFIYNGDISNILETDKNNLYGNWLLYKNDTENVLNSKYSNPYTVETYEVNVPRYFTYELSASAKTLTITPTDMSRNPITEKITILPI